MNRELSNAQGNAKMPEPVSATEVALNDLRMITEELVGIHQRIGMKLNPILSVEGPSPAGIEGAEDSSHSVVVRQLHEQIRNLRNLRDCFEETMSRIEL